VVLHGDNAQGKTSVLEAVHVLATLKSFRESRARRWIQQGQKTARIRGRITGDTGTRRLQWRWAEGARSLSLDEGPAPSLSRWFSTIRAVVFCPEDIAIIRGEPSLRRRFIDRAAFTLRPAHLDLVQDYRKVLRHKVALLKAGGKAAARPTFDAELCRLGARLILRRREAVEALRSPLDTLHTQIAGQGSVGLRLKSTGLGEVASTEEALRTALEQAIVAKAEEEAARCQALVGPHRDDLEIRINDQLARPYASQGQARSVVLALKLAQWSAAGVNGESPMFLLDDLGSELDAHRRGRLLELLGGLPGQVWVTTTDPGFVADLPRAQLQLHRVWDGSITPG